MVKWLRSSNFAGMFFIVSVFLPQIAMLSVGLQLTLNYSQTDRFAYAFLVFNAPAIIQIIMQPLLAAHLSTVGVTVRPVIIAGLRVLMGCLVTAALIVNAQSPEVSLGLFLLAGMVAAADQTLTGSYPLVAHERFGFAYARSASLANLIGRGSAALAPLIAGLGSSMPQGQLMLTAAFFVIGLACSTAPYTAQSRPRARSRPDGSRFLSYLRQLSPWAYWYMLFTAVANLAFACVAFVILSDQRLGNPLVPYGVLYAVFVGVNFTITLGLFDLQRYQSRRHVQAITFLLAGLVATYGFASGTTAFVLSAGATGAAYAILMISATSLATAKLAGPRYVEYTTLARSVGRIASLVSSAAAGLALSAGVPVATILLVVAAFGASMAILIGPKLTRKKFGSSDLSAGASAENRTPG
ncbi:hypothetical protein LJR235_002028 [Pararhizobium sp. LjRoot235]|uniref:hypothetical protein n=1 Tax=Pararhizobium sp. LjRoot235 TaxID=3342291 RepID=UPI003ECEE1BE